MSSTSDSSPTGHTITAPATLAGDPFAYAGDKRRSCFACYDGWVYLGEGSLVEDPETGEEVEVFEPVRCRRCNDVGQMAHWVGRSNALWSTGQGDHQGVPPYQ